MTEAKARIAGVFGRAAATYGRTGADFFAPFGRRLVQLAGVRASEKVLDVATGAGAVAGAAAAAGADVFAIDLAPEMVERARELGLDAAVMDAEQLELPDASFDVVLCGFGFFFCPAPNRALAEASRVLRPRGRIAFSTFVRSDQRWAFVDDLWSPAGTSTPPQPPSRDDFGSREAIEELVSSCGFEHVRFVEEELDVVFADPGEVWNWMWSQGMRARLEQLRDRTEDFRRELTARLEGMNPIVRTFSARFTLADRP